MPQKTYIKVKRGILEPKHCEAIGAAIWLYLYIIDHTEWETGIMHGYTDQDAADELGSKKRTVRSWRMKLEEAGYIAHQQKPHSLNIYVHNWNNPNSDWSQGDIEVTPTIQGDIEGDIEGDIVVNRKNVTLSFNQNQIKDKSNNSNSYTDADMQELFVKITGLLTFPSRSRASDIERLRAIAVVHKDESIRYCAKFFQEWSRRKYSKSNTGWLDWAIADDIPQKKEHTRTNGRTRTKQDEDAIYQEFVRLTE